MKVSEIKIPKGFSESTPNSAKLNKARNYYLANHKIDKPIKVDKQGVLVDGYISYLVLMEFEPESEVYCKVTDSYRTNRTVYVYGKHPNSKIDKEYLWRMPAKSDYIPRVGEALLVKTKFGIAPIIATRIEILNTCPVTDIVKKVIKWGNVEICEKVS